MKNLTDEQVFYAVAYAGASQYPWYLEYLILEDDQLLKVRMDNGQDAHWCGGTLTTGTMWRALNSLLESGHPGVQGYDWDDPEVDSDIDADLADQIIQYAVLGDVVFG